MSKVFTVCCTFDLDVEGLMPDCGLMPQVWSRHPRSGEHRIPARGDEQQLLASANSLLGGLSKDEVCHSFC